MAYFTLDVDIESFTPRALSLDMGIKTRETSCLERMTRICGGQRRSLRFKRPVSRADISGRVRFNTCRASFVRTYPRSPVPGSLLSTLQPIVYQSVNQINSDNGGLAHAVSDERL